VDSGIVRDVLTVLAGIGTGVMSGTFGVGGAVISTPAIRALGCTAALAVGTTLPSILPGAISGSLKYRTQRLVQWNVVVATVPAGIVSSIAGARISDALPGGGHPLMIMTALLLLWSASNLIRGQSNSPEQDAAHVVRNVAVGAALIGVAAGGMSGLLGVGGGIIMVPLFRKFLGLQMKVAVATSLICVGCFAIPGTITHAAQSGIDWRFALMLTVGVIPGAPLGARMALSLSDARLRKVFGVFLACVAVMYGGGELAALIH
jgi:uncharacterized membrane protein YfcA